MPLNLDPCDSIHRTLTAYLTSGLPDDRIAIAIASRFYKTHAQGLALLTAARAYEAALKPFGATLLKGVGPKKPKMDPGTPMPVDGPTAEDYALRDRVRRELGREPSPTPGDG